MDTSEFGFLMFCSGSVRSTVGGHGAVGGGGKPDTRELKARKSRKRSQSKIQGGGA